MTRDEVKSFVESHGHRFVYDRSAQSWYIHYNDDHRVRPMRLTGVRFKTPEEIPEELLVRLMSSQQRIAEEYARQDKIYERRFGRKVKVNP